MTKNTQRMIEERKNINNLFSESNLIFPVSELDVKSRKDIQSEFNSRVNENNEEGLIVRGQKAYFQSQTYFKF